MTENPHFLYSLFFSMIDLIKPEDGTKYVDLILGYEGDKDDEEELPSPPVRYFF